MKMYREEKERHTMKLIYQFSDHVVRHLIIAPCSETILKVCNYSTIRCVTKNPNYHLVYDLSY